VAGGWWLDGFGERGKSPIIASLDLHH
jgi:hypothetical protein